MHKVVKCFIEDNQNCALLNSQVGYGVSPKSVRDIQYVDVDLTDNSQHEALKSIIKLPELPMWMKGAYFKLTEEDQSAFEDKHFDSNFTMSTIILAQNLVKLLQFYPISIMPKFKDEDLFNKHIQTPELAIQASIKIIEAEPIPQLIEAGGDKHLFEQLGILASSPIPQEQTITTLLKDLRGIIEKGKSQEKEQYQGELEKWRNEVFQGLNHKAQNLSEVQSPPGDTHHTKIYWLLLLRYVALTSLPFTQCQTKDLGTDRHFRNMYVPDQQQVIMGFDDDEYDTYNELFKEYPTYLGTSLDYKANDSNEVLQAFYTILGVPIYMSLPGTRSNTGLSDIKALVKLIDNNELVIRTINETGSKKKLDACKKYQSLKLVRPTFGNGNFCDELLELHLCAYFDFDTQRSNDPVQFGREEVKFRKRIMALNERLSCATKDRKLEWVDIIKKFIRDNIKTRRAFKDKTTFMDLLARAMDKYDLLDGENELLDGENELLAGENDLKNITMKVMLEGILSFMLIIDSDPGDSAFDSCLSGCVNMAQLLSRSKTTEALSISEAAKKINDSGVDQKEKFHLLHIIVKFVNFIMSSHNFKGLLGEYLNAFSQNIKQDDDDSKFRGDFLKELVSCRSRIEILRWSLSSPPLQRHSISNADLEGDGDSCCTSLCPWFKSKRSFKLNEADLAIRYVQELLKIPPALIDKISKAYDDKNHKALQEIETSLGEDLDIYYELFPEGQPTQLTTCTPLRQIYEIGEPIGRGSILEYV